MEEIKEISAVFEKMGKNYRNKSLTEEFLKLLK